MLAALATLSDSTEICIGIEILDLTNCRRSSFMPLPSLPIMMIMSLLNCVEVKAVPCKSSANTGKDVLLTKETRSCFSWQRIENCAP